MGLSIFWGGIWLCLVGMIIFSRIHYLPSWKPNFLGFGSINCRERISSSFSYLTCTVFPRPHLAGSFAVPVDLDWWVQVFRLQGFVFMWKMQCFQILFVNRMKKYFSNEVRLDRRKAWMHCLKGFDSNGISVSKSNWKWKLVSFSLKSF